MKSVVGIYPSPYDKHPHNHDFNCAIVTEKDIYAYEDRKLLGFKYDDGSSFPYRSLIAGLKELNIKTSEVNKWVFTCPKKKLSKITLKQLFCDKLKACSPKDLNNFIKNKITSYPHHNAHINLAKNISGYESGYFLSIDGGGDGYDNRNLVFGKFSKNNLKTLLTSKGNSGLAGFHAVLTDSIGFGVDNGKTSGFASYGIFQKKLYHNLKKFFKLDKNRIPYFYFKRKKSQLNLRNIFFQNFSLHKYLNTSPSNTNILKVIKNYKTKDVAKTGEKLIMDLLIDFINFNVKKQENFNLVCSGGLFHNVAINQQLIDNLKFKNIFFTMSAGDGGLGLGLASEEFVKINKKKINSSHKNKFSKLGMTPFLGPSFNKKEILQLIKNVSGIKFKTINKNINKKISELVHKGKILGIFRGRAEYGPRSLGNRSIIADPRNLSSKTKINHLIKRRDWFMPFAPAVIEEKYYNYFRKKSESLYMQTSPEANIVFQKIARAGVHIDNSSRVQIVEKKINKNFWEIINYFGKKTGCYSVLNTSFNRHGISTIGHPQQALDHLLNNSIDILVLENFFIYKDNGNKKNNNNLIKKINFSESKLLNQHEKSYKQKLKKLKYKLT